MSRDLVKPSPRPMYLLAAGVVAVSFAALFIRLASAPAASIAFWRMTLAFMIQAPFLVSAAGREIRQGGWRMLVWPSLAGLALAGHFAAWINSLKLTTVASSTVLVATQPIWVVAGSYLFLRERLSWAKAGTLLLALAGSVLIGWGDFGFTVGAGVGLTPAGAFAGDLLALLGAVLMAVYLMIGRRARAQLSVGTYTFVVYGVSSLALFFLTLARGEALYPYPPDDWLAFTGLALVSTLGGHSLLNWSLRYLPASTVSIGILGEPVGATLWAVLLLGEAPTVPQAVGGSIVLAGLAFFTLHDARQDTLNDPRPPAPSQTTPPACPASRRSS